MNKVQLNSTNLKIQQVSKEEIPYNLLLLADPSLRSIEQYLDISLLFCAEFEGNRVGCYVLYKTDSQSYEIKNIAVDENFQGRGIGKVLIFDAIDRVKKSGASSIQIGTGNSSIGQLYLYQQTGFRITEIIKDHFTNKYDEPIVENGIVCRDMIMLTRQL